MVKNRFVGSWCQRFSAKFNEIFSELNTSTQLAIVMFSCIALYEIDFQNICRLIQTHHLCGDYSYLNADMYKF